MITSLAIIPKAYCCEIGEWLGLSLWGCLICAAWNRELMIAVYGE